MNSEQLIIHLHQLLQRMRKAGRAYREALDWDAILSEHTRLGYEEPEEPVLYKYDTITNVFRSSNVEMSNQILQYVVDNWDKIKPEVLEALRKESQEATDEYLTCLNNPKKGNQIRSIK